MNSPNLAIVIPAYKTDFFRQALESIANQTCKDFVLYIGDDASPDDLMVIVSEFQGRITINYTRFEENIGGQDIITHWTRCISLCENEEWIWLFSDDDILDHQCVENFYKALSETDSTYDLYRFNTITINEYGNVISKAQDFPMVQNNIEFLKRKLERKIDSYAVEYIFRKDVYEKNGFINFPTAWISDDATWTVFSQQTGIRLIPDSYVYWRYSGINISSNFGIEKTRQKLEAVIQFINWTYERYPQVISDFLLSEWSFFHFSLTLEKRSKNLFNFTKSILSNTKINIIAVIYGLVYYTIRLNLIPKIKKQIINFVVK